MPIPLVRDKPALRRVRCILHIGTPKTGSTALQYFLKQNRGQLARSGLVYPESIELGFAQHELAFLTGGGYPDWATGERLPFDVLIGKLRRELDAHPSGSQLVLSSENFYWLSDPSAVSDMLAALGYAPDTVAIVVYIRRQEDAIESWYNQSVKALGYSGSFEQSIADHDDLWDYEYRLGRWASVFGLQQMVVRTYAEEDECFDVRRDFLELLEVPAPSLSYPAGRENLRLVRDLLEFQRVINRLPLPTADKRRYHKQLIRLSEEAATLGLDDTPLHTQASRNAVRRRYEAGNSAVARTYFDRSDLFPPALEPTCEDVPAPPLSAEKLATIFAWLMMSQPTRTGDRDEAIQARER